MLDQPTMARPEAAACTTRCRRHVNMRLVATWSAQVVVALILAQTLFFKFTYAPETQVIFADRGGRPAATAVGILELLCVILLLVPRTAAVGAALSLLVISGAIFTHLTSLGIQVVNPATGEGDGGLLFTLAVIVAVGAAVVLFLRWRQLLLLSRWLGR
jgi:LPXTG-motif cell wall-anchored protein